MYAITFLQPERWDKEKQNIIIHAAATIGLMLSPYTGLSPEDSFNQVFGNIRCWFSPNLRTHAEAKYGAIKFQSNKVITFSLVIHEFAHLFSVRTKNAVLKQMLSEKIDATSGSDWTGNHPPTLAGYNTTEKFCNLFEIWIMGLFAWTDAAEKLCEWMNANMKRWCAVAMGKVIA